MRSTERGAGAAAAAAVSQALEAWADTRELLRRFDSEVVAFEPIERQRPREVRRVLDALRAADRTRPRSIPSSAIDETRGGEEPRAGTWTERQIAEVSRQARVLRDRLTQAQERLLELLQRAAGTAFEPAASAAEATITGILRPLSRAIETSTEPLQRGLRGGFAIAALALAFFAFRPSR